MGEGAPKNEGQFATYAELKLHYCSLQKWRLHSRSWTKGFYDGYCWVCWINTDMETK